MGLASLGKAIVRYIRYGKQIGITSKTGNAVYKRGKTITGLDKNGNIINQLRRYKVDKFTTKTVSKKPIPFDHYGSVQRTEVTVEQYPEGTYGDFYRRNVDKYGHTDNVYDIPWEGYWVKNRKTGKISGFTTTTKSSNPSIDYVREFQSK